ncbi:helix-turn-helix domain-containing protein [Halopiger thermotolerans]
MLLAAFRIELDALALTDTFDQLPDLRFEAQRVAAHSTKWTMPCMWASNVDFDQLDTALADEPTVDTIVDATEFGDEKFYQLEWSADIEAKINAYVDSEASILHAEATADGWEIRIRFGTRDQFDAFRDVLAEAEYDYTLLELSRPDDPRHMGGKLTPAQRNALRRAKELGYYKVPREISTRELADELEMSHQNLSELLRRATDNLVDAAVRTTPTPEPIQATDRVED